MSFSNKLAKRVEDEMTVYPSIASKTVSVTEAIEFMSRLGIRHLPVVEKNRVIGVVSDRDLKQVEILSDSMTLLVGDVMNVDPYCVKVGTSLGAVARVMAERKVGSAVILNNVDQVVGIFTTTDAMRVLSEILDEKEGSSQTTLGVERFLDRSYLS
jgi:acetoin utilization protein AcuB